MFYIQRYINKCTARRVFCSVPASIAVKVVARAQSNLADAPPEPLFAATVVVTSVNLLRARDGMEVLASCARGCDCAVSRGLRDFWSRSALAHRCCAWKLDHETQVITSHVFRGWRERKLAAGGLREKENKNRGREGGKGRLARVTAGLWGGGGLRIFVCCTLGVSGSKGKKKGQRAQHAAQRVHKKLYRIAR